MLEQSKSKRFEDIAFKEKFSELLRDADTDKLANTLEVSQSALRQWSNGFTLPTCDKLIKMSKYFGVSTDWLLGLSEHRNQKEVDSLIASIHELDGLETKEKSLLLWSLDFVIERLKILENDELRKIIVQWLALLIQDFANMIYLPDNMGMDDHLLVFLTSPHRGAIDILNKLDEAIAEELSKRLLINYTWFWRDKGGSQDGDSKEADK